MISRRNLLVKAAGIACADRLAEAQVEPAFKLDFGKINLEPGLEVKFAADTSGFTTCQVRLDASDGTVAVRSKEWGTEPNKPNSLKAPLPQTKGPYRLSAEMRPTSARKPSMALGVNQDPALDIKTLETIV